MSSPDIIVSKTDRDRKKSLGQYMTPPAVAKLMAARILEGCTKSKLRILEPAAGCGVLVDALVGQLLARRNRPSEIEVVMYELDASLKEHLQCLANVMRSAAKVRGVKLKISIRYKDFLLNVPEGRFDIVIANPPFFKLRKDDPRSIAHKSVVHGQPNIYGIFMAVCARVLNGEGRFCFLSPRSWTSGAYFAEVRRAVFQNIHLDAIHLFSDREGTFKSDRIQQEMMISWGRVFAPEQRDILVSVSSGADDLSAARNSLVPLDHIFTDSACGALSLSLSGPRSGISLFADCLSSLGFQASTGKVVPFRCRKHIESTANPSCVPLLWMSHVKSGEVLWPLGIHDEYMIKSSDTEKLLLPTGGYVFVRRFSPRDNEKRVTAAPFWVGSEVAAVGVENHINYIRSINREMSLEEVVGLSAYLNSRQVSCYLNARLGNTQINAADLNSLPSPSVQELVELGVAHSAGEGASIVDVMVDDISSKYKAKSNGNDNRKKRTAQAASV